MNLLKARRSLLCLCWVWLSACRACDAKTTVPFKRAGADAAVAPDAAKAAAPAVDPAQAYPEGTREITWGETRIERSGADIRASLHVDADGDKRDDVVLVTSDDAGQPQLELITAGNSQASALAPLSARPIADSCRTLSASLRLLGPELGLASVDFMCDAQSGAPAAASGLQPAAAEPAAPSPEPTASDLPPPEPRDAAAHTQHYVFSVGAAPRVLLRVAADWQEDAGPVSPVLTITGADSDNDQLSDVQVSLSMKDGSASTPPLGLVWLNRPTGLARERQEPEASLAAQADAEQKLLDKKPQEALARATQTLALHALLCKEAGNARLWIDNSRGLACGSSAGAGKALAVTAIAHARLSALLPALEARHMLERPGYALDARLREQVTKAIGTIRGDTSYVWTAGPNLRPGGAPSLRLPALGFIDENSLLLRGPIPQSYDLTTRLSTPTGMAGSLLASDGAQRYVLTDIVRGCAGLHVRIVPFGRVIGGVVTGAPSSEPLLAAEPAAPDFPACQDPKRARSERAGFQLIGLNVQGAVLARGKQLWLLPLDAQGNAASVARVVGKSETLTPLLTPSALDRSARHLALATSEGVAVIDRAAETARLIRSPASCAGGTVSDAVISPSARKVAMLCAGRVYVAEPAADSGATPRPTSETP